MKTVGVAIVGLGTVGSGVAELILKHGDRFVRNSGKRPELRRAVVSDLSKSRSIELPPNVLTNDINQVIVDESVSLVAQLLGGTETARDYMIRLLKAGKDVVTANKALIAEHGEELFSIARDLDRSIAFEASVCGGVPVITTLSQCLSANKIRSIQGILNGTSNYIVTQMEELGADYESTVKEAQRLGYAEADPTFDVDGSDAAQKLAILVQLAFDKNVDWKQIRRRGIDAIENSDFDYARQLGYRIKLIANAEVENDMLQLSVSPMLIRIGSPLAEVRENFNAVNIVGDAVGPVFLHGQGAGQMPTASAVVADLIDSMVGRCQLTQRTLSLFGQSNSRIGVAESGTNVARFYLRFNVEDHPGVLAQIAGILGNFEISIASVIQQDDQKADGDGVPVVIMTQTAPEKNVESAVEQILKMDCVSSDFEHFRILE